MMRTSLGGTPRACATWDFTMKGAWVDAHTVTLPFSHCAAAAWGSRAEWAT